MTVHTALGNLSDDLHALNNGMRTKYSSNFLASALFLASEEQEGAIVPVVHAGGNLQHRQRADTQILYRRLTPKFSLASLSYAEDRELFDSSIMFPDEHKCLCLPLDVSNSGRALLQIVFDQKLKDSVDSKDIHNIIDGRIKGSLIRHWSSLSGYEDAVYSSGFPADEGIIINLDLSNYRELSKILGARETEVFISSFFTQALPELIELYGLDPLRLEGDGLRLTMPLNDKDCDIENLNNALKDIVEKFDRFCVVYKRGFEHSKLKIVCEVGETTLKKMKKLDGSLLIDQSGPVDAEIKSLMHSASRTKHDILYGRKIRIKFSM